MKERAIDAISDVVLHDITHEELVDRVIAALREPSAAAARAGAGRLAWGSFAMTVTPEDAANLWRSMIDSA